jgi:hypothetical protein
MSNMFQVLFMMAIPAALFLTFRYLNLRGDRTPVTHDPAVGATVPSDSAGATGNGASTTVFSTHDPLTRRLVCSLDVPLPEVASSGAQPAEHHLGRRPGESRRR